MEALPGFYADQAGKIRVDIGRRLLYIYKAGRFTLTREIQTLYK